MGRALMAQMGKKLMGMWVGHASIGKWVTGIVKTPGLQVIFLSNHNRFGCC